MNTYDNSGTVEPEINDSHYRSVQMPCLPFPEFEKTKETMRTTEVVSPSPTYTH